MNKSSEILVFVTVLMCGLAGLATATPHFQIISERLAGATEGEQKEFIRLSERCIRERSELKRVRFLLEKKSGYSAVVHAAKGPMSKGPFTGGTVLVGALPDVGTNLDLIAVEYGHPLKSTYSFYFNRSKDLVFVFFLPEG